MTHTGSPSDSGSFLDGYTETVEKEHATGDEQTEQKTLENGFTETMIKIPFEMEALPDHKKTKALKELLMENGLRQGFDFQVLTLFSKEPSVRLYVHPESFERVQRALDNYRIPSENAQPLPTSVEDLQKLIDWLNRRKIRKSRKDKFVLIEGIRYSPMELIEALRTRINITLADKLIKEIEEQGCENIVMAFDKMIERQEKDLHREEQEAAYQNMVVTSGGGL